jgi:SAM-dependent methyltransferase
MAERYPSPARPQRLVFGEVAETYEAVRPGYPGEVFDRVLAGGRRAVVEVGAGTGKATGELLARGARVDAVEPSAEMAQVLRAKFAGLALRVVACGIEEAVDPVERAPRPASPTSAIAPAPTPAPKPAPAPADDAGDVGRLVRAPMTWSSPPRPGTGSTPSGALRRPTGCCAPPA